jgi:cytochrome c-type biogenesis protein CcmH/NrfG
MFFPKLRRQAKWMFLFLALVFAVGFVGFGVGAGGIGLGNVVQGSGDSGVPSVGSAEKRVSENPRDPEAFRDLATAHQAEGNTDEAIEALENLARMRPKDVSALRDLAGLYLAKSSEAQQEANNANFRAAYIVPGATIAGLTIIDGKPLDPDPISSAVNGRLSEAVNVAFQEAQTASSSAVDAYRRVTVAVPKDVNARLDLAQAAVEAGDGATAISAYEAFLRLDPENPLARDVRRQLNELKKAQATPPISPSG